MLGWICASNGERYCNTVVIEYHCLCVADESACEEIRLRPGPGCACPEGARANAVPAGGK